MYSVLHTLRIHIAGENVSLKCMRNLGTSTVTATAQNRYVFLDAVQRLKSGPYNSVEFQPSTLHRFKTVGYQDVTDDRRRTADNIHPRIKTNETAHDS